jgi:hypothetical protein
MATDVGRRLGGAVALDRLAAVAYAAVPASSQSRDRIGSGSRMTSRSGMKARRFCAVCRTSRPMHEFTLNAAGTPSYECLRCVRLSLPVFVQQVHLHLTRVRAQLGAQQQKLPRP